jgi:hypothetical protein
LQACTEAQSQELVVARSVRHLCGCQNSCKK